MDVINGWNWYSGRLFETLMSQIGFGVVVGFAVLSVPAGGFGTITAAADPGIVQLGLKFTF